MENIATLLAKRAFWEEEEQTKETSRVEQIMEDFEH